MLSDFQQNTVWECWLAAQIRAAYFADLVQRFQTRQKLLVAGSLTLSSAATLTLLTAIVPPALAWIKPALTVLAAILSLWSLAVKNERASIDCADLHFRWNCLAFQYETLWSTMYSEDAIETLARLRIEELAVSKSSTSQPTYQRQLEKAYNSVVMQHRHRLTA